MRSLMKECTYQALSTVTSSAYGEPVKTYSAATTIMAAISETTSIVTENNIRIVKHDTRIITDFMPSAGDKIDGYIIQEVKTPDVMLNFYISRAIKETSADD